MGPVYGVAGLKRRDALPSTFLDFGFDLARREGEVARDVELPVGKRLDFTGDTIVARLGQPLDAGMG